jgi:hypothetical protein
VAPKAEYVLGVDTLENYPELTTAFVTERSPATRPRVDQTSRMRL